MADYVNKNILSQAYVHIEMTELSAENKKKFEHELLNFATSRGKFALYEDIAPEVETKDGSLKVYSSITGTLSEALGDYPTFEEALNNLYVDAKRLAEGMILETLFLARARGQSITCREARTGIIKSAKDLFDQIYALKTEGKDDSPAAAIKRISKVRLKLEALLHVLLSEDDKFLIKTQVSEKIKAIDVPHKVRDSNLPSDRVLYQTEKLRLITLAKVQ